MFKKTIFFLVVITLFNSCGSPPQKVSDIYGQYEIDDNFWAKLYPYEKAVDKLKERVSNWENKDWQGAIFLDKGGGVSGHGVWEVNKIGTVKNAYGNEYQGISIRIEWIPGLWGTTVWPDGEYLLINESGETILFPNAKGPAKLKKTYNYRNGEYYKID